MQNSETGNRTPGICVTGRDVTNYTISDWSIWVSIPVPRACEARTLPIAPIPRWWPAARRTSRAFVCEKKKKLNSVTGNRTPGICVTGRDVTNYTMTDEPVRRSPRTEVCA